MEVCVYTYMKLFYIEDNLLANNGEYADFAIVL